MTHSLSTRAVHAGRDDLLDLGVHAPPLDLSTTYPAVDCGLEADRIAAFAAGGQPPGSPLYSRLHNPTVARFETAIAALETADAAVAFGSGMAALSACLLAVAHAGRPHVVAVRPLYGGSDHLLNSGLLGTSVDWVEPEGVAAAIRPDTGLVVIETPANPTLVEIDIAKLAEDCGNVPLLVDNTVATPVLQRPIEHGAAVVVHSATKFLGGHGDVLGGVVCCAEEFAARVRQIRVVTGAVLHPLGGYLLHRGLTTLPLRVRAQQATAEELARRLGEHDRVARVYYPGLDRDRPKQMDGGGALLSFDVTGDAARVVSAVRLVTPAVSLGSVDTLIQHPASLTHRVVDEIDREAGGVTSAMLRLSIGLEDVDDLWADLERALAA
ncbi:trans-sulfuration enzyme family protein [Stackebrandtia soli]|uniref:trans-sulfuration enzyme family protein n=1 Tax=Stackebrandtia soli TaxID=1892856 RepID=UPI0039EC34D6